MWWQGLIQQDLKPRLLLRAGALAFGVLLLVGSSQNQQHHLLVFPRHFLPECLAHVTFLAPSESSWSPLYLLAQHCSLRTVTVQRAVPAPSHTSFPHVMKEYLLCSAQPPAAPGHQRQATAQASN